MQTMTNLKPLRNRSFYGKAKIVTDSTGGIKWLRSYNTIIAAVDNAGRMHRVDSGFSWSATSARHLEAFGAATGAANPYVSKRDWIERPFETTEHIIASDVVRCALDVK